MRKLLTISLLMAGLAGPVLSATLSDAVVAELAGKGYTQVQVVRTWLGRIVITASLDGRVREITINPKTGQILRDFFRSPVVASHSDSSDADGSDPQPGPDDAVTTAAPDGDGTAGTDPGVTVASPVGADDGEILIDSVAGEGGE